MIAQRGMKVPRNVVGRALAVVTLASVVSATFISEYRRVKAHLDELPQ